MEMEWARAAATPSVAGERPMWSQRNFNHMVDWQRRRSPSLQREDSLFLLIEHLLFSCFCDVLPWILQALLQLLLPLLRELRMFWYRHGSGRTFLICYWKPMRWTGRSFLQFLKERWHWSALTKRQKSVFIPNMDKPLLRCWLSSK